MPVLLGLRLLLELALVAAMALLGSRVSASTVASWAAAVGLAAATVLIWGLVLSPRRRFDLPLPLRTGIEVALFTVAAVGLALAGQVAWAVALAGGEVVVLTGLWVGGLPPGSDPGARR